MTKTCQIRISTLTGQYYLSFGPTRSTSEWKTFGGAQRFAKARGYDCTTTEDPRPAYKAETHRTKIVTNLISGKLVRIPVHTPDCCDPSTESYWSM